MIIEFISRININYIKIKCTIFISKIWQELEEKHKLPTRARDLISLDYKEFAQKIDEEESKFCKSNNEIIDSG